MIRSIGVIYLFCMCATPLVAERTWTDQTGKFQVVAELLTVRKGQVYLERENGKINKVPIEKLSENDLKHLASLDEYRELVAPFVSSDEDSPKAAPKQKVAPKTVADDQNAATPDPPRPMAKISANRIDSSGGLIRQFKIFSHRCEGVTFSSDGAHLVVLGHDNMTVIGIDKSSKKVYEIEDPDILYRTCVTFSPDGKTVIAGTRDGTAAIWDFRNGQLAPKNKFAIEEGEIKSITISPDNQTALSLHRSKIACLWSIETGEVLKRFTDFDFSSTGAVLFSRRGGQSLLSDGKVVALLELPEGDVKQWMQLQRRGNQFVVISPDGSHVATDYTSEVHFWETATGKHFVIDSGETQLDADFSPDGSTLITGGHEKVNIWDLETGSLFQSFPISDSGMVNRVAISPDGIHFTAFGSLDKTINVFRLPTKQQSP